MRRCAALWHQSVSSVNDLWRVSGCVSLGSFIFFSTELYLRAPFMCPQVWLPYPFLGECLEGSCQIPPPPTPEEDNDEAMSMMGQWFRVHSALGVYTVRQNVIFYIVELFLLTMFFISDHFMFILFYLFLLSRTFAGEYTNEQVNQYSHSDCIMIKSFWWKPYISRLPFRSRHLRCRYTLFCWR